jgi:hypothetical protein
MNTWNSLQGAQFLRSWEVIKEVLYFMKPKRSLLCIREPTTGPCSELHESTPPSEIILLYVTVEIVGLEMRCSKSVVLADCD